jgi:hypothetical protein
MSAFYLEQEIRPDEFVPQPREFLDHEIPLPTMGSEEVFSRQNCISIAYTFTVIFESGL